MVPSVLQVQKVTARTPVEAIRANLQIKALLRQGLLLARRNDHQVRWTKMKTGFNHPPSQFQVVNVVDTVCHTTSLISPSINNSLLFLHKKSLFPYPPSHTVRYFLSNFLLYLNVYLYVSLISFCLAVSESFPVFLCVLT